MWPHLVVNTSVCFKVSIQIGHSVEIQGDSTHGTRDFFSGVKTFSPTIVSNMSYSRVIECALFLLGAFGGLTRVGLCIGVVYEGDRDSCIGVVGAS